MNQTCIWKEKVERKMEGKSKCEAACAPEFTHKQLNTVLGSAKGVLRFTVLNL